MDLITELVHTLLKQHQTIATCESVTAGLFAAAIAAVPHASNTLQGGVIAYQNHIKEQIVGVKKETIMTHGVISAECVKEMAVSVKEMFGSDIGVAFSGNAGPDTMEGKPVGCVWVGISDEFGVEGYELQLSGTRNEVRQRCVVEACRLILDRMKAKE